jgi:hypothetical protein
VVRHSVRDRIIVISTVSCWIKSRKGGDGKESEQRTGGGVVDVNAEVRLRTDRKGRTTAVLGSVMDRT